MPPPEKDLLPWERDKQLTDPYLPMVKAICAAYILSEAPLEEDRDHNTDLMVLAANGVRIGVRLRAPHYYKHQQYQREFTIRDSRPRGGPTELAKILDGWGHYFFYGFRTENPPHLWGFGLLDLEEFRTWMQAYFQQWGRYPGTAGIPNEDGSSTFTAIEWTKVPPASILVMYPKKIAVGSTLMPEQVRESIQLALELTLPGYARMDVLADGSTVQFRKTSK